MMNLVGKQLIDFKNKQTGEQVEGIKLHFTDDTVSNVKGAACLTQFVSKKNECYQKAYDLPLGPFKIYYGYGGRIEDIIAQK